MVDSSSLEIRLNKLESIFAKFDEVCNGQAKEIKNTQCLYTAEQVKAHLESMEDKERLLKVGIIGRVKAGKSSLINALLFNGKEVLPKAATPMTAALTTIGYSEQFTAKVEFFTQDDINKLREKSQRYVEELEKALVEKRDEIQRRQQRSPNPNTPAPAIDETRLRSMAQRMLNDREPMLKAAADLYELIHNSSLSLATLPTTQTLEAASEKELNKELYNYVGSGGKFMPFTKTLHIGMPQSSLDNILVVDTPGLSDAVASREQRTYEILKECNVVFIVSPAGQFLNDQDLELANRLTKRDGIQEIYVVASQVDTQLHSSERQKHNGHLPDVILGLQGILAQQAASTLRNQDNEVLKVVSENQSERLFVTSGICQTLLAQPESEWDETARHTHSLLIKNYADYFTPPEQRENYLQLLAGHAPLLDAITKVRHKKADIFEKQSVEFVKAQEQSSVEAARLLIQHFTKMAKEVEVTEISTAIQNIEELKALHDKAVSAVNNIFTDRAEDLVYTLSGQLQDLLKKFRRDIKGDMKSAEGATTETYQRETDGFFSGFARWSGLGGYEEATRTCTTLNAHEARDALEDMHRFIQDGLLDATECYLMQWRRELARDLVGKLRETIGDELVDGDKLASACRAAIQSMKNLTMPDISELPAELAQSSRLKGHAAETYLKDAGNYLSQLQKEATRYVGKIKSETQGISKFDMGAKLFGDLQQEMQQLRDMVENKRLTLDKLNALVKQLGEVAA